MNNRRCRPSHSPREYIAYNVPLNCSNYYLVTEHKQCNQTTIKKFGTTPELWSPQKNKQIKSLLKKSQRGNGNKKKIKIKNLKKDSKRNKYYRVVF